MRNILVLFCMFGIVTGLATADPADLGGGVHSALPDGDAILE